MKVCMKALVQYHLPDFILGNLNYLQFLRTGKQKAFPKKIPKIVCYFSVQLTSGVHTFQVCVCFYNPLLRQREIMTLDSRAKYKPHLPKHWRRINLAASFNPQIKFPDKWWWVYNRCNLRLRDTVGGVFRAQSAITSGAHLHQTTATKNGAQIERHLVRTHSQKE